MRKMLVRETVLVLAAAVLAAGMLASCSMDDVNMPYSPYFKIEKKDGVYVACGIYEDRLPEDGNIEIPDGVELDETWDVVYDKSDKRPGRNLDSSKVNSISIPAGASSKTLGNIPNLAGWPNSGEADIDIIYQGSLADWCENGNLNVSLHRAKSIQVDGGQTDPRMLERITASDIAGAKRIGDGAFSSCEKLTSVEIPDSVTEIGDYAFMSCTGLTSVTIGKGVKKISNGAFYGCGGLTTVDIPGSVTEIGDSAFYNCSQLKEIAIPNSVTEIGGEAFYGCKSLESVTFAKTDGWYCVNSDGNKVSVDFSDPKNNAGILKEEHPTYARKTE